MASSSKPRTLLLVLWIAFFASWVPEHLPFTLETVAMHRAVVPLMWLVAIVGVTYGQRGPAAPMALLIVLTVASGRYLSGWGTREALACADVDRTPGWRAPYVCGLETMDPEVLELARSRAPLKSQRAVIDIQRGRALRGEGRFLEANQLGGPRLEDACVTMTGVAVGLEGLAVRCDGKVTP